MSVISSHEAAALAGITFRQLDYWERTGLVPPAQMVGNKRYWRTSDIARLRIIKMLLDAGIKLESIRGMDVPSFTDGPAVADYMLAFTTVDSAEVILIDDVPEFMARAKRVVTMIRVAELIA